MKYNLAMKLYEEGECLKAISLFEQLIPIYRMTEKGEEVYYHYAMSQYCQKAFYLAEFYFKNYVKNYPNSERAEECAFLSAYCMVKLSPDFSLDQTDTRNAINNLQLFLERYPNTEKRDTCNTIIDGMRAKLEKKSFEKARLFYRMENYQAASVALKNTLKEFPDTKNRELIMSMVVISDYRLAANSIESKKCERFENTIKSYHKFVDSYSTSAKLPELEKYFNKSLKGLENCKLQ